MTNKFIMMIGLPASGKSRIAHLLKSDHSATVISSDKIREELYGDENIQGDNVALFAEVRERIFSHLESGENVIFDATNVATKYRRHLLSLMKKIDVRKMACVVATPYDECLSNNVERERIVPEHIIKRMREGFFIPFYEEGWDEISIIWNVQGELPRTLELFSEMDEFDQENPNHSLTLGEHVKSAHSSISKNEHSALRVATLLHDIGKVDTKVFTRFNGEPTVDAHYFSHENCGAYNSMFYLKSDGYGDGFILSVCKLIQFHMRPYHSTSDKAVRKFIGQIGEHDYNELLKLNEADRAAH